MKKTTLFLFLTISSLVFCQEKNESQLLKVYSESELSELKINSPERYELLFVALVDGLEILDFPKEKSAKVSGEISLPSSSYTFASLGIKILESNQYFRIKETNKMLLVKSFYTLNHSSYAK